MIKMKHQCPFCGEWITHLRFCNGFCECSGKYYVNDNIWFNRDTREVYKGMKNLEYIDEGE